MIINVFKTISLLFHFLQMLLCTFFAIFFQLLYMTLLMDNCSYKLFFVGKRVWEQVDSTNVIITC